MFSRKKPSNAKPKSQPRSNRNLSQYGLFDIPNLDDDGGLDGMEDDEGDDELEAELLALTGGSSVPKQKTKQGPVALPTDDLDRMVAASLRDIPSDEEESGDEDDPDILEELNVITNGEDVPVQAPPPALPSRGHGSGGSQLTMLRDRLSMYQEAETNAKTTGESARARRLSRGIKTLSEMIKQASAGKPISEEDIPPPVAVKKTEPKPALADSGVGTPDDSETQPSPTEPSQPELVAPLRPAPAPPVPPRGVRNGVALAGLTNQTSYPDTPTTPQQASSDEPTPTSPVSIEVPSSPKRVCPEPVAAPDEVDKERQNMLVLLTGRQDEYKHAALAAKKCGDTATAIRFIKIAKQFETVITAVENGQPVDLSAMPPPPTVTAPSGPESRTLARSNSERQKSGAPAAEDAESSSTAPAPPPEPEDNLPEDEEYVVEMPSTVLEALEQRMAKYRSQEEAAKAEGNSSKARRMGRIVKQYADAIRLHKAGKPLPIDELPTPPGYPPIPVEGGAKPPPSPRPSHSPAVPPLPQSTSQPTAIPTKVVPTPANVLTPNVPGPAVPQPSTSDDVSPEKQNVRKSAGSHQERQLQQLQEKQKQFRLAAVQAKKRGEVNQAKEYLRLAKGFDKLIEASNCGLPVDMATVPVPPSSKIALESDFDIVSAEDCAPSSPGSEDEILEKLEKDLIEQMKKSMETRNHFKAIGDVASANRFEQQALHCKKDLDVVRVARKQKHPVPRFHYETRSFSIVQCNTDLMDNDVELTIAQGVNYNVPNPKEIDTYIRFEFPWPNEEPYRDKTATVYNTNNPVYDEKFTIPIQRNVRACQRVFKRHAVKCEVWSKGGFFRGDSLVGTAVVKLQPLETKCTLHESFDLMDGRKAVGGKLEVKVRLRNPILTKQVERVEEKWLVIDH